jgi:hypothetical protein
VSYALLAFLSLGICYFFIFYFPYSGGVGSDSASYKLVADNILNGCGVSMSKIGSATCIPHFGGNQGPGYPAFIASTWLITGHSDLAVRLLQAFLYSISIIYLVESVSRYTKSFKISLILGIILVISPLHTAWSRFILSECLTIAGTLWVFAEIIRSLQSKSLRILPIAFAFVFTTFMRLDAILILFPIIMTAFFIHRPIDAIKKIVYVGLIFTIPWSGWLTRNYIVGLDNLFQPKLGELINETPGVFKWTKTWSTHQYSSIAVYFPIYAYAYDEIVIDEEAYSSNSEKNTVRMLLDDLQNHINKPFPDHIDEGFSQLAQKRIEADPLRYYLILPLKRTFKFWVNLNAGYGLPGFDDRLSAQERLDLINGDIKQKIKMITKYPFIIFTRILAQSWKLALYIGFIIACWLSIKNKNFEFRDITLIVLSFILIRSFATGAFNLTEARFSATQMPILELAVILSASSYFKKKINSSSDPLNSS